MPRPAEAFEHVTAFAEFLLLIAEVDPKARLLAELRELVITTRCSLAVSPPRERPIARSGCSNEAC